MSEPDHDENELLRHVTLQNAKSIELARRRAVDDLVRTKEALELKTAELAGSLSLMRATLESTTDGVLATDRGRRITSFNDQFVRMWEIPRELLERGDHGRLLEAASRYFLQPSAFRERVETIYATAPPETYDLLERLDGKVIERFSRMQVVEGRNVGRVWSFRDITERRRAEQEVRRRSEWLRVTLESIGDGVITTDKSGRVSSLNGVAEATTGWTELEARGRPLEEVFRIVNEETRAPVDNPAARALREGRIVGLANHTILLTKSGEEVPIDDSAAPIRDDRGQVHGVVLVFRGIAERRKAEQDLRRSEGELSEFFENASVGLHYVGPDGTILRANRAELEMLGYSRDEFIGMNIADIDLDRERIESILARIREGEDVGDYEARMRCKDGSVRHFLITCNARRENGVFVHTRCFTRDITDRKRIEETTRFLAVASAALTELTDSDVTLQRVAAMAAPAFADWCLVDVQEGGVLRRVAVGYGEPSRAPLAQRLYHEYPPEVTNPAPLSKVLASGSSEWAPCVRGDRLAELAQDDAGLALLSELDFKSYLCTPIRTQAFQGVLTFLMDGSGRSFGPSDLDTAEDLAHRAGIAIANAGLLRALKEADRRKDEFLAILAHELRNPLAPVRNAVQIMRLTGSLSPELEWAREVIERQVQQMSRLVDDLLDISRITSGKIQLRRERIQLAAVVNSAVEASRPLIDTLGHRLSVRLPREPVLLDADFARLSQVVLNLLNNAAKYTEHGGRIWLTAEVEGARAVLRVRDTGIGIPADMLPRIFEMFAQVDRSLERSQGGLGIGLTLVQELVEMHGGEVEALSAGPGRGSEFVVRLPILGSGGEGAPAGEAVDPGVPTSNSRVLVVDDNRDAAESLAVLLRLHGCEVRTANDGLEAVAAASVFSPQLVLLDLGLPKLSGYDAARQIREQQGSGVVLIAVTGWGQDEDRRRSREAGFDHHLVKPVELGELQELLPRIVRPARPG
jgi:PAS domain S-box-containing protein